MTDAPLLPFQAHSPTSRAAATAIEPTASTLRAKVLEYLTACGDFGATDLEIQHVFNMDGSTQRPRRLELVKMGKVCDSGERRTTPSGRTAVVWRVVG